MSSDSKVLHSHSDRQWDIRVNVQDDDYLQAIVENVMLEAVAGKIQYVLIGGLEIGTKPNHSDYKVRHVHIALMLHNRTTKGAIIKNFGIIEGNGYYMVPRNREMPYQGWRDHHTKEFSKVNPTAPDGLVIYEFGSLPADSGKRKAPVLRSEMEKKMRTDDIIREMHDLIENDKEKEAFEKFPRNFLTYGEKIKARISQKALKKLGFTKARFPHVWVYGPPGTGKTSLVQFLFEKVYKKDLNNRFWDLYSPEEHDFVLLEDLDMDNIEKLSIQFLKTICDEGGFPIDQKYKTPQLARANVLVTSQYSVEQIITPDNSSDVMGSKRAIGRRFLQMSVWELHRTLGIKLINEYERKQLKKQGNDDPSKLYMSYDYRNDCPTGEPLKAPKEYRDIIFKFAYE